MGFINPLHIIFVAVVALLVLGPKRFPEVARSVGNGYREFREQLSAVTDQARVDLTAPAAGSSTVEHASVVEEIAPPHDTLLVTPDEASVTGPAAPAGTAAAPTGEMPAPPA